MLILTRRVGESIVFGDDEMRLTVLELRNGQVRIGVDAPKHIKVYRDEIYKAIQREKEQQ